MSRGEIAKTSPLDLSAVPEEDLLGRLSSLLAKTADDLREMAAIVAELERRGKDLSGLRLGIVDHLRRIAAGQLLPEVVVHFAGYPSLLRIAVQLPLPDQRKLVTEESLSLAVWREGRIQFRRVDPLCLSGPQVRQVFRGDHIRSDAEQVSYLEDRQAAPAAAEKPKRLGPPRRRSRRPADRRGLRARGRRAGGPGRQCEMPAAAAGDEEKTHTAIVFHADEYRALKMAAAEGDTSITDLVRRALWTAGILVHRKT